MYHQDVRASDVARNTDISAAAISRYLKGDYMPKHENIVSLSRFLNVDVSWLRGDEDFDQAKTDLPDEQALIEKQNKRIAKLEKEQAELRLDIQLLKTLISKMTGGQNT
jgi:transcriptional regulator with XRE-family HTH domain